jgi:hAT family C-terminal dimerisation region
MGHSGHCGWTLRYTSLHSLKELIIPVSNELQAISQDNKVDSDVRAKASGFLNVVRQFEFCIMLLISEMLFQITDSLSKVLQDASISACDGKKAAGSVIIVLQKKRSQETFETLWKLAEDLCESNGGDPPCLPRTKRVPKRHDDGGPPHIYRTPKEYYSVVYFQILDEASGAIQQRFEGEGYEILLTAERVIVQSFAGDTAVERADLNKLQEHFRDDLDFHRLPSQLEVLANIRTASPVTQLKHAADALCLICAGERCLIPDVITLMKLCLVLPASTASAERSFSALRRVKSYLRSTMSQPRLNHVLILNAYREMVDELDMNKIITSFILRNEMRQRTFAVP